MRTKFNGVQHFTQTGCKKFAFAIAFAVKWWYNVIDFLRNDEKRGISEDV
jgi:hypothetical protein